MLDFSWSELALIGVVALVVIGPKDLPRALRTAGTWARKARTITREFQSSIDQMIREAELDEVKKQVQAAASVDLEKELKNTVDPGGSLEHALKPPEFDTSGHGPAPASLAAGSAEAAQSASPSPAVPADKPAAAQPASHQASTAPQDHSS